MTFNDARCKLYIGLNKGEKMEVEEVKKLVGNKIFTAIFTKKDGSVRKMNCRLQVKKHLKGGTKKYDAASLNYLTVYDLQKKAYRTINVNTLKQLKFQGQTFAFQDAKLIKNNKLTDKTVTDYIDKSDKYITVLKK